MTEAGSPNVLRAAREHAGMTAWELWLAYFSLGGMASAVQLEGHIQGRGRLDRMQHDILVQALNDRFVERGMDHPVPYAEDEASAG
jgi:hypothetical protein